MWNRIEACPTTLRNKSGHRSKLIVVRALEVLELCCHYFVLQALFCFGFYIKADLLRCYADIEIVFANPRIWRFDGSNRSWSHREENFNSIQISKVSIQHQVTFTSRLDWVSRAYALSKSRRHCRVRCWY